MKALPRILYFLCFVGLALVAALALNEVVRPSMVNILLRTVIVASLCGAPGLIHRRLWPLSLVLLPVGVYLLLRTITPVPSLIEGIGGQYHFYVEQLRLGTDAYLTQVFPLDSTDVPELPLLLAFSVYWLVGAAAFLSLSLRRPVPGIVLTLVLLGFSLTVDGTPRVLWSAILFLILAACLLVLSRGLKREEWKLRDVVAGGAVGVVASLLALLLLGAAPSAVAAPWQDWRTWDPFRQGASTYTFNWLRQYPDLLDPANNVVIMRVESSSPSYWRANALDTFTGTAWTAVLGFLPLLEPAQNGDSFTYTAPEAAVPTPPGPTVTQTFQVQGVNTNYFFVGGDPISLTIDQNLVLRTNDTRAIHSNRAVGPSFTYNVTTVVPDLEPADVVGRGNAYPDTLDLDRYLGLPFQRVAQIDGPDKEATWRSTVPESTPGGREWVDLYSLNQEIVGDATDPYEITLRIERHLRNPRYFEYSLTPPRSEYTSPYSAFLFDTRSGYCQHFAGAMALLLRYNGIPARVAVGFTGGEQEDPGVYTVSTNNAHAWVEVYFPQLGWVAFDPTPGRSLPAATSASSPGFINPFVEEQTDSPGTLVTEPPRDNVPEDQPVGGAGAGGQGSGASAAWIPWVVGLIVLFVAWPGGRSLWRKRRLTRGLLDQRLQASLALLRSDMASYGLSVAPSCTLEETLSVLAVETGIEPDPVLIARAEAILFGGYHATRADVDRAEALRQEAVRRLRSRHGWVRAGLTWYGVPRRGSLEGQRA